MNIFKYDIWKHPRFWLHNIGQFFRNIRYAFQLTRRGFSDPDWWMLDYRFSKRLCAALRHFAKHTCSFPIELYEKYGDDGLEKWQEIVNEIADNLEVYTNELKDWDVAQEAWKKANELLVKWHGDLVV